MSYPELRWSVDCVNDAVVARSRHTAGSQYRVVPSSTCPGSYDAEVRSHNGACYEWGVLVSAAGVSFSSAQAECEAIDCLTDPFV